MADDYSTYDSVSNMLDNHSTYDSASNMLDNLGWRSLKNQRIDSRLVILGLILTESARSIISPHKFQHFFKPAFKLTLSFFYSILTISLSHLQESSFYLCTDCATAHTTRERVLQYEK